MPRLSTLPDIEFAEAGGTVSPVLEPLLRLRDIERCLRDILLDARLPCHAGPAFPICAVKMSVGEDPVEVVAPVGHLFFLFLPLGGPPFKTRRSPFFTGQLVAFLKYSPHGFPDGCDSRVRSPGMKRRITIKRRHASSVRPDLSGRLFTRKGRSCSPSIPLFGFRPRGLLCLTGQDPKTTPFELFALLLLTLPLEFT